METLLFWQPLLSLPVLAALGALLVLIAGYALYQGRAWHSVLGRIAFGALALLALAQPAKQVVESEPQASIGLIVVDDSPSVHLQTDDEQRNALIAALESQATEQLMLQTVRVTTGQDGQMMLGQSVQQALEAIPAAQRAGVIVVSDGQWHDGADAWPSAPDVPINTLLVGKHGADDAILRLVNVPSFGLVGRDAPITIRLDYPKATTGQTFPVSLSTPYDTLEALIPANEDMTLTLPITNRGDNTVTISVDMGGAPDAFTINNRHVVTIQGVRERLQVLLVSGSPYAGGRTWRDVFAADPMVDLVHFTILRPPEKTDMVPRHELSLIPFPVDELFAQKIYDFDLIIFDRYEQRGVLTHDYFQNIATYVQRGGALLMTTAPSYADGFSLYHTPLGSVLPAAPTGQTFAAPYTPVPSELGQFHPILRDIPREPTWGQWLWQVDAAPISGDVLLEGLNGRPLLMVQQFPDSDGRVALLLSDQIWLWKRGYDGGGPYNPLLKRLVHWLMREPTLDAEQLRGDMDGDTLQITRQHVQNPVTDVTIVHPDDSTHTVSLIDTSPYEQTATHPATALGWYAISDGTRTRYVAQGAVGKPELMDIVPTSTHAKKVAESTRGGVVVWEAGTPAPRFDVTTSLSRRPSGLQLHQRNHAVILQSRWEPLLLLWAWGLLLILVGGGLWWREGRG